ncbi:putative SUMO protease [Phytophthora cinnamomi]|uniref:putative SUMO protease n=1 Tax=Phytophthora cinnamomi TaxID=4785 RepID=UPI00355A8BCB|nr:putative SUMO protease [Phytophthora cinnamomi]
MQQTQASLDAWRYQRRLKDAANHSRNLQRDFPVDLIKPSLASAALYTGLAVRQEVSDPEQISFDRYRRRLQEFDREEYGPSPSKRQKLAIEKVDHVREQSKQNLSLLRRLQSELSGRRDRRRVSGAIGFGRMGNRASHKQEDKVGIAKQEDKLESDTETKEEVEPTQIEDDSKVEAPVPKAGNDNDDEKSITVKSREEEIAELEAKLRAQHLSRTSEADRLFYDRLAERETSTIFEEVLLDELYGLAVNVFDEEEEKSRNKELPPDLLEIVEDALHEGPMEEVLIQKYNVDITRRHLQVLLPGVWLNDEVINFYFQMMSDRDEALVNAGVLSKRSHFFNSFFFTKVSENGYNFINVRRWTRKIDLFAMDKIFMPVNVGNMHWCMAVIFMTEKRIQYYDSMHGSGAQCLKVLFRYLHDESEHKKKQKFDEEGWELVACTPDTPQQNNGSDCGVFSCMFADYLSQSKPLTLKQKDIPFHRHRMVLHVSRGYIPLEEEGL